jgi:hypothetical protein
VICIELIDGAPLAACNHFKRIDGAWRLVHHQSSPIAQGLARSKPDSVPPAGSIH